MVVNYICWAAGFHLDSTGSRAADLGKFNPLRYRGYIYDEGTGLYYLQSRYYHPSWQRFISADSILGRVGGILEHNLYAYCCNNPVVHSDPTGLFHGIIRDGELLVTHDGKLTEAGKRRKHRINAQKKIEEFLNANVKLLKVFAHTFDNASSLTLSPILDFAKLALFINLVKSGSMFDIKNQPEWQYQFGGSKTMTEFMEYNGQLWSAEELGNYAFGYFGAAYGYDREFLCIGAGMYQIVSNTWEWSYFSSYFDDPRDTANIRMGFDAYWAEN